MLILGQGALSRADGAAIQHLAQRIAASSGMIGPAGTPAEGGWNGFNVLHTAASRVGALDLGFVPVGNGRDTNGILDGTSKGDIEFVFLLGVDEIDMARLAGAFVVYQGTHGDAGAHRADVVFPGAAYTEKSGLYVNSEGRVQLAARATFPPGDAKEDWAILRALSDVAGRRLPYDDIDAVRRAILADAPHFATRDVAPTHKGADPGTWNAIGTAGTVDRQRPLMSPIADFYLTNPVARSSEASSPVRTRTGSPPGRSAGPQPNFVATTTSPRRAPSAAPRNRSQSPTPYDSAVSKNVLPASRAASTTRCVPSRSIRRPKLLHPSPTRETSSSERPRGVDSIPRS
jgi:NADH-quinone oxidoreductase subunit G